VTKRPGNREPSRGAFRDDQLMNSSLPRLHLLPRIAAALLWLSWLFAGPLLASESPLRVSLDRADGCFEKGATARLTIQVDSGAVEARPWQGSVSTQRDWVGEAEVQTFPVTAEPIHLEFPAIEPGQLIFTVTLRAEGEPAVFHTSRIGALFQPEKIELSTPEPADFDAFWESEKATWRGLPQSIRLDPVSSPTPGVRCWDLTIELEGESPVSGYLAIPESAGESSLPALLLLHGAGVRSANLPTAARQASLGFIALDINAHGLPNGRSKEFYQEQSQQLGDYRQRGSEARETWYFRTMYLRILTAIDYLCDRPEWNGRDLVLRGSSQGGAQALAGAGLDPRVTVVAASVPALCDLSGERIRRKSGWPQPVTAAASRGQEAQERILETVGYYDCGLHARRTRATTLLSLGFADATCPAVGIQAMANNLPGQVEFIYRPDLGHAFTPEIQQAFDQFVLKNVQRPD
jgi:cephalosporin-C deacetylase